MRVSLTMLGVLLMTTVVVAVDDAVTRERLEAMLESGDGHMIVATYRRHPDQVLPFIDGYLEGGLKMIEQGESESAAKASFRRGIAFAELAQQAFGDDMFLRYAASFASWSPTEQQNFRKGQRLYRDAREYEKNGAFSEALRMYRESQHLAESLNDSWGLAMTLAGRTRVEAALERNDSAIEHGREAINLYRRLRLEPSEIELLLLVGELEVARNPRGSGLGHLRRAWDLVKARPVDNAMRTRVLGAYRSTVQQAGVSHLLEQLNAELDEYGRPTNANGEDERN